MTARSGSVRGGDGVPNKGVAVATSADAMVQHTNDDSVVSKRSAVAKHYITDPYLRYFVHKPSRRAPLINRGYYLRMVVMTDVVVRCLRYLLEHDTSSAADVQVVSLGAGFDTLAFRALLDDTTHAPLTPHDKARTFFYDVDFPSVMQAKATCMRAAPPGTFPTAWQICPESTTRPVTSAQYNAIGVDLRGVEGDVAAWLHALREAGVLQERPTLLYAECVTQYLPPERSEALLRDIARHFARGIFVSYDQLHPQDSFGGVMQQSLRQRCSPLLGIASCGDGVAMQRRALRCGMRAVAFADFHALSRHYIAGAERQRVAALEPFDEAEEWAAMCEHYGITVAVTDTALRGCCEVLPAFRAPLTDANAMTAAKPSLPTAAAAHELPVVCRRWPSGRFGFEGWGNGAVVAESSGDGDVVLLSFGGFVAGRLHQRVNRVYCHSLRHGELTVVQAAAAHGGRGASDDDVRMASAAVPALQYHSFTRLTPWCYVVFGGRTNPTQASGASYCLRCDHDSRLHAAEHRVTAHWTELRATRPTANDDDGDEKGCTDAPEPRYRHCAVALSATELFIYGGRSGVSGGYLSDAWLGTVDVTASTIRWRPVELTGEDDTAGRPAAMVSAAMLCASEAGVADDTVWLCGGLQEEGNCSDALWQINVRTGRCVCLHRSSLFARFSHTLTPVCVDGEPRLVLLLGGSQCESSQPPTDTPDGHAAAALLHIGDDVGTFDVRPLVLPADCPSWTRHSCVPLGRGVVAVLGGGLTCFSFGTFVAKPHLLQLGKDIAPVPPATTSRTVELTPSDAGGRATAAATYPYRALLSLPRPTVEEVRHYTAEAFAHVARQANRPVVFRATPLGPCVARWGEPAYLQAAETGTTVSVHVARGSHLLDFVRKNFAFTHVPFEALVEHVVRATTTYRTTGAMLDEVWYYRSIAAHMKSERANVWRDFRCLGGDFVLPPGAQEYIMPRLHQACLRINAPPLQLWTHYDTFDNVLCQIVGRKRVVLFPPSEYNNLYMTGSSSAVMDLDAPDLLRYPRFIDACKTATEVILEPGDMLYFPAQWPHHITTLGDDSYSISVNVFFEHFPTAEYDPKDLYGNKDLPSCGGRLCRRRQDLCRRRG